MNFPAINKPKAGLKGTNQMNGYGAQVGCITYAADRWTMKFYIDAELAKGRVLVWCDGYCRVHLAR